MDLLDQLLKVTKDASMDFNSIVEDFMMEDAVASAELKAKHAAETLNLLRLDMNEKLHDNQIPIVKKKTMMQLNLNVMPTENQMKNKAKGY